MARGWRAAVFEVRKMQVGFIFAHDVPGRSGSCSSPHKTALGQVFLSDYIYLPFFYAPSCILAPTGVRQGNICEAPSFEKNELDYLSMG